MKVIDDTDIENLNSKVKYSKEQKEKVKNNF